MEGKTPAAATQAASARLAHAGLRVRDLSRMAEFYATVLGLGVSDRGVSARHRVEMAFLTGDPAIHHQVALVAADENAVEGRLDHLAFAVDTLDALRAVRDRAVAAGAIIRTSDHGNAWAIYFTDPEGNRVEVFATSPFEMPQPFGRPFELDQPDADILAATRDACDAR